MNVPISAKLEPGSKLKSALAVGGVVPFTATDYPGKLATVVFVQGCPWRCGYCHNPHLQPRAAPTEFEWEGVLSLLKRRVGLVDAVVFSGGEPTVDPALTAAMRDARSLGYQVGLHSGGIYPARIEEALPLLDWIGLDIKAPFDRYDLVTQVEGSGVRALASIKAMLASGVAYEVRTTIHPSLLHEDDIRELAAALSHMGVADYVSQVYRVPGGGGVTLGAAPADYPAPSLIAELTRLFPRFSVRRT